MAKDDYYTIVCKILIFLYKRLKGIEKREPIEYILCDTKDFPIDDDYMKYVIEHMEAQGLIDKVIIVRVWGGDIARIDWSNMRITPAGIDYLQNNSTMVKVANTLKEALPIISLFG